MRSAAHRAASVGALARSKAGLGARRNRRSRTRPAHSSVRPHTSLKPQDPATKLRTRKHKAKPQKPTAAADTPQEPKLASPSTQCEQQGRLSMSQLDREETLPLEGPTDTFDTLDDSSESQNSSEAGAGSSPLPQSGSLVQELQLVRNRIERQLRAIEIIAAEVSCTVDCLQTLIALEAGTGGNCNPSVGTTVRLQI